HVPLLTRLTWVLAKSGEPDLAGNLVDRVIAANPKDMDSKKSLAETLTAAGNFAAAMPIYEQLIEEFPEASELRLPLADVTLFCRKYDLAVKRFQPLLEQDFEQPKLWAKYIDAAA